MVKRSTDKHFDKINEIQRMHQRHRKNVSFIQGVSITYVILTLIQMIILGVLDENNKQAVLIVEVFRYLHLLLLGYILLYVFSKVVPLVYKAVRKKLR